MASKNRRFRTKASTRDATDDAAPLAAIAADTVAKQKTSLLSFGGDDEDDSFRVNKPKRQEKAKTSKFRNPAAGALSVPATLQRAQAPAAGGVAQLYPLAEGSSHHRVCIRYLQESTPPSGCSSYRRTR